MKSSHTLFPTLAVLLTLFSSDVPAACDYVFGIGRFAQPNPYQEIVEPTKETVARLFADKKVCIRSLSTQDLMKSLERGELDFFISSSGMYRRMLHTGVRDVAAVQGPNISNANYAEGSLLVTNAKRYPIGNIEQFQGKILAAGITVGFTGYLAGIYELKRQNINAESFFSRIDFIGANQFEILERVLNGKADIGILRTCMLEAYLEDHPDEADNFRIINEKASPNFPCRHSTDLYPSWVFGVSKNIDVATATQLTTALLKMPTTASNWSWGIATDFSLVDQLLRDMQMGPFKRSSRWYVARIWENYSSQILLVLSVVLMIFVHAWRSDRLVQQRTQELNKSHAQEIKFRNERNKAREKILDLQRIGVVGQFSSLLIHELGQPSSANLFLIHAFRRRMESQEPTKQDVDEVLEKLLSNVQREQKLIDKIRKYAKSAPSMWTRTDLFKCIHEAKDIVSKTLVESVSFTVDLPGKPIFIKADELELEILFVNLIKNAAEAVRDVPEPEVGISAVFSDNSVQVVIKDNGPRLSDEQLQQIGMPLKSKKTGGLGLGVYICQMIVEKYGGTLQFSRAGVDCGLCTLISIPIR